MLRQKLKLFMTAALAGAMVLSLASCAKSTAGGSSAGTATVTGGKLVVGTFTEPDSLDPYKAQAAGSREILFNMFEGLVKPDKNGNMIPAVAQSYQMSSDATSYTFQIRDGVKFQDGKAVTADDVKYSITTAAGLGTGQALVAGLNNIKSVDSIDSSDVKISLKSPDSEFLPYLTVAIIPNGYTDEATKPMGTGPFAFVSFTPQQSIILKKNPYYWQKGLPYLDSVTIKIESTLDSAVLDLQGGSIDMLPHTTLDKYSQLSNQFNIAQGNLNAVQQLVLNNKVKPFDNAAVRQALSYAIDPDEVIKTVGYGKGTRVGTPVIPGLKKYFDSSLTYAYKKNTAKAKELLAQAGYPNGFSFTITVPSNYQVHIDTAQVLISELKAVGITATIKQVDWGTWLSQVYTNRQYDATVIAVDGMNLSPRSFLQRYVSTDANNFMNYNDPQYDALYAKAVAATDDTQKVSLYKQCQELISKDAANVFLEDQAQLTPMKKDLAGYVFYPLYVQDLSTVHYTK